MGPTARDEMQYLSLSEVARALAVSERTVERHLENTYRKIAARNRADAVAYAVRHQLREP
jgi:DNA-binding CsgD family transcriptional regulator